jgi:hypothetical protein
VRILSGLALVIDDGEKSAECEKGAKPCKTIGRRLERQQPPRSSWVVLASTMDREARWGVTSSTPHPFVWTKSAEEIIEQVERGLRPFEAHGICPHVQGGRLAHRTSTRVT